jgi:hypothetical protein
VKGIYARFQNSEGPGDAKDGRIRLSSAPGLPR